jgi:hypothetical protein
MAVKLAEPNIARAVVAVVIAVVEIGRVIAVVIAVAAIYRSVYFYSSFYSINIYQYAHPLKLKSYIEAV